MKYAGLQTKGKKKTHSPLQRRGILVEFSEGELGLRVPMERTLLLVQLKVHTAGLFWPAAL